MVLPIALLLAMNAADVRTDPKTRAKCHHILGQLRPSLIVSIGLASDYMQECMTFLRLFEKDIDFATVPDLIDSFRCRMKELFLEAKILEEVEGDIQTGALSHVQFILVQRLDIHTNTVVPVPPSFAFGQRLLLVSVRYLRSYQKCHVCARDPLWWESLQFMATRHSVEICLCRYWHHQNGARDPIVMSAFPGATGL